MKKKGVAIILGLAMAIIAGRGISTVSAADFTDGNISSDLTEVFLEDEFANESDEFDAPLVSEEEVLCAEDLESWGDYSAGYITQAEYDNWMKNGEMPNCYQINVEGTFDELFTELENSGERNTGIIMVCPEKIPYGFADITAPKGTKVVLVGDFSLSSMNGDFVVSGTITTLGTLELEAGTSLGIKGVVDGIIEGTRNNVLSIYGDTCIGGISNIQKTIFNYDKLVLQGKAEFFDIENNTSRDIDLRIICVHGYNDEYFPVFHKTFDFGKGVDVNGNEWTIGIGLKYFDDGEVPECYDNRCDLHTGAQIIRFADNLSLKEIYDITDRCYVSSYYGKIPVLMDGTIYVSGDDENNEIIYQIETFRRTGNFSEECNFNYWKSTYYLPDTTKPLYTAFSLDGALKIIEEYQQSGIGVGFYHITFPKDETITEVLSVPESVEGIVYSSLVEEYSEEIEIFSTEIIADEIFVPEGKTLKLDSIKNDTGSLRIYGYGEAVFWNCRLNQKVVGNNLTMEQCCIKSLECENLTSPQFNHLVITDALKVKKLMGSYADILIKSEAAVELGDIECKPTIVSEGKINFIMEVKDQHSAVVNFTGGFKDYNAQHDGKGRGWNIGYYDELQAMNEWASFARDIFEIDYDCYDCSWGYEDGPYKYRTSYKNVKNPLMKVSENTIRNMEWDKLLFEFLETDLEVPSSGITVGKCNLLHTGNHSKTSAYINVDGTASLDKATVASIPTQIYTGKAVTPSVKVTLSGNPLKKNVDYTVSYKNNTRPGKTATVVITGKGAYTGTINKTFKIAAVPSVNKRYAVGNLKYKITRSHYKTGEVSVYGAMKKTGTGVTIPSTVKIGGYTFKVTKIDANAFRGWTKLKKAVIGAYVKSIGQNAFYGCKSLRTVEIKTVILKTVEKNAFRGIYSKAIIKVPSKQLNTYQKLLKGKGQSAYVKIVK